LSKLRSASLNLTFKIECMKINEYLYFLSFIVSLLLGGLSFVISRQLKSKEFMHLTEFWGSLAGLSAISYIFRTGNGPMIGLSLLGWIWPIKTIIQVAQDMSGVQLYHPSKVIIPAVGGFITLIMASNGFSFAAFSTPFCLSIGVVGGIILFEVFKKSLKGSRSFLGNVSFSFLGLLFFIQLVYPLWRFSSFSTYGVTAQLLVLIGLAATTLSFYMEILKERQGKMCESVLKERSDQFVGQSKYSELGMMSAGIAHEINNPLAIIQAKTTQLLRLIRDPGRISEVTNGLEQILYTSERINRTIQGVREFVHQDEAVPYEEFSVKHLVDDVLAFCGQRMKNHGVNLRFYGVDNYSLRGHKIQLEQVLLNLLNNAFDAIEFLPDKWIELSVRQTENSIQIYVKDSGSGIPPETASRMMEAFYTTKKVGKGTGLGLALARGIVEKHGGSLAYIGNTRHTTFMLELPKPGIFRPLSSDADQGRAPLH
jgi:signal transduction histidine kinase